MTALGKMTALGTDDFPVDPDKLTYGQLVVVRFGRFGEQLARYRGRSSALGPHRVEKWRANSGRWTKPAPIITRDFLRIATADDLKKPKFAGAR